MVDSLSDVEDMDPLEAMNDLFTHFRIDLYDENGDQVLIDEVVEVREAESATKTLYLGAESDGMAKCSNCDEQGHRKTNCPHPERVKVVYPHILPDFEKWKSGESKMQLVGPHPGPEVRSRGSRVSPTLCRRSWSGGMAITFSDPVARRSSSEPAPDRSRVEVS